MYKVVQSCIKFKMKKRKVKTHMVKEKNEYLSIQEFAKEIGVCTQTLRRWDTTNKLKPHHKTPNGYRIYTREQIQEYLGKK